MTELREMTYAELGAVIDEVLAEWPQFGTLQARFSHCACRDCSVEGVRKQHGDEAAEAWSRLYTARWLRDA